MHKQDPITVGKSNTTLLVQGMVLFVAQMITGGALVTAIVWLQMLLSPHELVMAQNWVIILGQTPLVVIPSDLTNVFGQQELTIGPLKFQVVLQATVLLVGQVTWKLRWLSVTVKVLVSQLPQASHATHVTVVVVPAVKTEFDGGVQTTVRLLQHESVARTV